MTTYIRGSDNFSTNYSRIIQVVGQVFSAQTTQTITTTDMVVNGMTVIFNTKEANSKFVIYTRWFGEAAGEWENVWNIRVNGNRVNSGIGMVNTALFSQGMSVAGQSYIGDDNSSTPECLTMMTNLAPNFPFNSTVTVELIVSSFNSRTMWSNRCFGTGIGYETGTSEIIIMEVL